MRIDHGFKFLFLTILCLSEISCVTLPSGYNERNGIECIYVRRVALGEAEGMDGTTIGLFSPEKAEKVSVRQGRFILSVIYNARQSYPKEIVFAMTSRSDSAKQVMCEPTNMDPKLEQVPNEESWGRLWNKRIREYQPVTIQRETWTTIWGDETLPCNFIWQVYLGDHAPDKR